MGSSESTFSAAFNGPFTSSLTGSSNIIGTSDEQNIPLGQILLPLENNGGPTQTHGLPASSPAINAGDNASCLTTDQRGEARDDGACDIGAVEGVVESDETMFVIPLPNGKTVIFGL